MSIKPDNTFLSRLLCLLALIGLLGLGQPRARAAQPAGQHNGDDISQAIALTPDIDHGSKIYPLCASCHLKNGWGKKDGSFPVIAGQHRNVLIKQLEDIRLQHRDNPTMYPFTDIKILGGLQGVADVTAYIASLPVNPSPGVGSGRALALGKRIYRQNCVGCHGADALGNN